MTAYRTRSCTCKVTTGYGGKRPKTCEHGNRFLTKAQINPPPRKPPNRSSEKNKEKVSKRGSTLRRTQRRESAAERAAREHFNETVKAWPCWFMAERPCEVCGGSGTVVGPLGLHELTDGYRCPGCKGDGRHHCSGPKDAHHLIPKQFIRQRFEAVLPEPEFVAILFNPKIGAPLCRKAHDQITLGADRIYFEDLSEECLEYVGSLPDFMLMRLELEAPKRAGVVA